MRTLRTAFVGGFAGALMAGNVATLHAAPLPTNVASMKLGRLFDTGLVGRLARRGGHKCAECLKEVRRQLTNISSRPERFRHLKSGCLPEKPLDGRSGVEMP
jgi:hypothetical protein